jgi:hypothetical protein
VQVPNPIQLAIGDPLGGVNSKSLQGKTETKVSPKENIDIGTLITIKQTPTNTK